MKPTRYFIGHDESGHSYLVPVEHHDEWEKWTELDQDTEAAWDTPTWATILDGGTLTFEKPRIGREDIE